MEETNQLLADAKYMFDLRDKYGSSIAVLSILNKEGMHLERMQFLKERVKDVIRAGPAGKSIPHYSTFSFSFPYLFYSPIFFSSSFFPHSSLLFLPYSIL